MTGKLIHQEGMNERVAKVPLRTIDARTLFRLRVACTCRFRQVRPIAVAWQRLTFDWASRKVAERYPKGCLLTRKVIGCRCGSYRFDQRSRINQADQCRLAFPAPPVVQQAVTTQLAVAAAAANGVFVAAQTFQVIVELCRRPAELLRVPHGE